MKLFRTLFDRISSSLLATIPGKYNPAVEYAQTPPLRLVSDKAAPLAATDSSRRPSAHTVSQPDAIDDAIRRSQSWFLSKQDPAE
ncbi:MAG: squalene--hopene cyclase, partial [Nitrospirota bacterium]